MKSFKKLLHHVRTGTLIIRKADKGRQFVLLDADDYAKGVKRLLYDETNYTKVPFNGKFKAAALIRRVVTNFGGYLSESMKQDMLLFNRNPATRLFYALPKTHKSKDKWVDGVPPMRPICPDVKTESTASGKYIAAHLQPLVAKLPSYLANSFDLVNELQQITRVPDGAVMMAVDIEALYPSIPTGDALNVVVELLQSEVAGNMSRQDKALIVELLRVQLTTNYFVFRDETFLQIKGVPMGKPWAPAVACLYMGKWDSAFLSALGVKPLVFRRYIDDIFLVLDSMDTANRALRIMSTLDDNIRVGDYSIGRKIHFLDLNVELRYAVLPSRNLGPFCLSVFRKDTDLRVIVDFASGHSPHIKFNALFGQLTRIWRLSNDMSLAADEITTLVACMRKFRNLSPRTTRKLLCKFRSWIVNDMLGYYAGRNVNDKFTRSRKCVCWLPFQLNEYRVQHTLDSLYDRLTSSEKQYTGKLVTRNLSVLQLSRALF
jgi:hypothetical protein